MVLANQLEQVTQNEARVQGQLAKAEGASAQKTIIGKLREKQSKQTMEAMRKASMEKIKDMNADKTMTGDTLAVAMGLLDSQTELIQELREENDELREENNETQEELALTQSLLASERKRTLPPLSSARRPPLPPIPRAATPSSADGEMRGVSGAPSPPKRSRRRSKPRKRSRRRSKPREPSRRRSRSR